MMLGLVLVARNEGRGLGLVLRQLGAAMRAGAKVLVISAGSQEDTLAQIRFFGESCGQGAGSESGQGSEDGPDILRLDQDDLDMAAALALGRDRLGTPYVLGLGGEDLICADAIAPLIARLIAEQPDLMICNHSWRVAGRGFALPCVDAARMAALAGRATPSRAALRGLLADPRRFLLAGRDVVWPETGTGAGAGDDWDIYDTILKQAGRVAVFTDPVVLRPEPDDLSVALFKTVAAQLAACPPASRLALMERLLPRLGDGMAFYAPENAMDVLRGAARLREILPPPEWHAAARVPGPAGGLLGAVQQGGDPAGLGVLAHLAATQDRARLLALSREIRALREDLDLALPGDDYLRALYERVRHI